MRSCHHRRGRMMSRALTHRSTYFAFLGGGDTTVASDEEHEVRRKRKCHKTEATMDRAGAWTRAAARPRWQMLRNCLMAGSWVLVFSSRTQVPSSHLNLSSSWSPSHFEPTVEKGDIMIPNTTGTRTQPTQAQIENKSILIGHPVITG